MSAYRDRAQNPSEAGKGGIVGWIVILLGGLIFLGGFRLARKFSSIASYRGIGSFRLTREGLACYLGRVMIFVGIVFVLAGILLLQ